MVDLTFSNKSSLNLKSFQEHHFVPAKTAGKFLAVCLHGRGSNLLWLRKIRHRLKLDDFNYLFLNAPDPWTSDDGHQGFSWYGKIPEHREGIVRSLKLLEQLMRELERYGFTRDKIMLVGFSQGCVMSLELALRSPIPFFGVLGISGTIFKPSELLEAMPEPATQTPVFMIHGTRDELLDLEKVRCKVKIVMEEMPYFEFMEVDKGHDLETFEYSIYIDKINEWRRLYMGRGLNI